MLTMTDIAIKAVASCGQVSYVLNERQQENIRIPAVARQRMSEEANPSLATHFISSGYGS